MSLRKKNFFDALKKIPPIRKGRVREITEEKEKGGEREKERTEGKDKQGERRRERTEGKEKEEDRERSHKLLLQVCSKFP